VACTNNKVQEQSTHLPYYNEPNFTPIFISNTQSVNDSITHQIGNFSFTNQHGKTITQEKSTTKFMLQILFLPLVEVFAPR
jgi:protein SCO1/2